MFDRSSVDSLSKMPMGVSASVRFAEGPELAQVRRQRECDALVRRHEFGEVEVRELECFSNDDRILFYAIRSVNEIAGVELEQAPAQSRERLVALGERHDLHAQ